MIDAFIRPRHRMSTPMMTQEYVKYTCWKT